MTASPRTCSAPPAAVESTSPSTPWAATPSAAVWTPSRATAASSPTATPHGAAPWQIGQPELNPRGLSVGGFSVLTLAQDDPEALRALAADSFRLAASGKVELPVTAEFPLAQAAEAHRLMDTRTTTGKLLLRVAGE